MLGSKLKMLVYLILCFTLLSVFPEPASTASLAIHPCPMVRCVDPPYVPICGSDGKTYGNECDLLATCLTVTVAHTVAKTAAEYKDVHATH